MFNFFSYVTAFSKLYSFNGNDFKNALIVHSRGNSLLVNDLRVLAVYSRTDHIIFINENFYIPTNVNKRIESYKDFVGCTKISIISTDEMNNLVERLDNY